MFELSVVKIKRHLRGRHVLGHYRYPEDFYQLAADIYREGSFVRRIVLAHSWDFSDAVETEKRVQNFLKSVEACLYYSGETAVFEALGKTLGEDVLLFEYSYRVSKDARPLTGESNILWVTPKKKRSWGYWFGSEIQVEQLYKVSLEKRSHGFDNYSGQKTFSWQYATEEDFIYLNA